jgi:NADPH:quinone reductase-like Zn-dependent oxidoreductase
VTAPGKPLERERWAGAVDTVGSATLPYVLRTLRIGAAVASSGNTSGAELHTTVFPFILRGCALLGMDSANMAIGPRRALWARLGSDLLPRGIADGVLEADLNSLEGALDGIHAGQARGRWVVRATG